MAEKKEPEISPLPYLNTEFLKTPAARVIRILSEYLEPAERLRRAQVRDTIVFFGSARSLSPEQAEQLLAQADDDTRMRAQAAVRLARYYRDAVELSRRLTQGSKS